MNSKIVSFTFQPNFSKEPKVCSSNESIDDSGADKQVSHQEKNSKKKAFDNSPMLT